MRQKFDANSLNGRAAYPKVTYLISHWIKSTYKTKEQDIGQTPDFEYPERK